MDNRPMTHNHRPSRRSNVNAIAVVAKCPIPGKSKTRLLKNKSGIGLTEEGCAAMARAMLSDVIASIDSSPALQAEGVAKFLYFAPPTEEGREIMVNLCRSIGVSVVPPAQSTSDEAAQTDGDTQNSWHILPMPNTSSLTSSDLGAKLSGILLKTRCVMKDQYEYSCTHTDSASSAIPSPLSNAYEHGPALAFVGMDSPELPLEEISQALKLASGQLGVSTGSRSMGNCKAYICPSHDGGYGMLCVPPHAPPSIFEGVRWSDSLTALSQIKAMTDHGVEVTIGSLMRDIDEVEDLVKLGDRLERIKTGLQKGEEKVDSKEGIDVLVRPATGLNMEVSVTIPDSYCKFTWEILQKLLLLLNNKK